MLKKSEFIILELLRKSLNEDYQVDESLFGNVVWAEVIEVATNQGCIF